MNPFIKSPYQMMLDRLGLSPIQQALSPQQMQAEMIARGQTPQHFQAGGHALNLAPELVNPISPSMASKVANFGGKGLAGLGLLGSLTTLPEQIQKGKYSDAAINYGNALYNLGMIAPKLVPPFLGYATGPLALYDALRPTEMGDATLDEWNRRKAAEEEERRRRILEAREYSPVVVNPLTRTK